MEPGEWGNETWNVAVLSLSTTTVTEAEASLLGKGGLKGRAMTLKKHERIVSKCRGVLVEIHPLELSITKFCGSGGGGGVNE